MNNHSIIRRIALSFLMLIYSSHIFAASAASSDAIEERLGSGSKLDIPGELFPKLLEKPDAFLHKIKQLTVTNLDGPSLPKDSFSRFAGTLESLTLEKDVHALAVKKGRGYTFKSLPPFVVELITKVAWANLKELHLKDVKVKDTDVLALSMCPSLIHLRELDLNFNSSLHGSKSAIAAIASAKIFANLTHLDLGGIVIDSEGASAVANSPYMAQLTHLNLQLAPKFCVDGTGLDGIRAIAESPYMRNLKVLLSGGRFGPNGAKAIAQSPHMSSLERLSLNTCLIQDEGVSWIAQSPHMSHLTHLNLVSNNLTDKSIIALANSPYMSSLKVLELGANPKITRKTTREGKSVLETSHIQTSPYLKDVIVDINGDLPVSLETASWTLLKMRGIPKERL